jgi:hypothetical protein
MQVGTFSARSNSSPGTVGGGELLVEIEFDVEDSVGDPNRWVIISLSRAFVPAIASTQA